MLAPRPTVHADVAKNHEARQKFTQQLNENQMVLKVRGKRAWLDRRLGKELRSPLALITAAH